MLICLLVAGLALPASGEEMVAATFGGTFVDNSKKCDATTMLIVLTGFGLAVAERWIGFHRFV